MLPSAWDNWPLLLGWPCLREILRAKDGGTAGVGASANAAAHSTVTGAGQPGGFLFLGSQFRPVISGSGSWVGWVAPGCLVSWFLGFLAQGSLKDTFCNHLKQHPNKVGNHHLQVAMFDRCFSCSPIPVGFLLACSGADFHMVTASVPPRSFLEANCPSLGCFLEPTIGCVLFGGTPGLVGQPKGPPAILGVPQRKEEPFGV